MKFAPDAKKLKEDIAHGGRFGPKSAQIAVELIYQMAIMIDELNRRLGELENPARR